MSRSTDANGGISAARWAGAGLLGGASIMGMLWALVSRPPVTPTPAPVVHRAPSAEAGIVLPPREPGGGPGLAVPVLTPTEGPVQPPPETLAADPLPVAAEPTTPAGPVRLDINTASAADLELLPGIGPTLASRIIEYRERHGPMRSLDHLMNVKGIGQRTADKLAPYVRFE